MFRVSIHAQRQSITAISFKTQNRVTLRVRSCFFAQFSCMWCFLWVWAPLKRSSRNGFSLPDDFYFCSQGWVFTSSKMSETWRNVIPYFGFYFPRKKSPPLTCTLYNSHAELNLFWMLFWKIPIGRKKERNLFIFPREMKIMGISSILCVHTTHANNTFFHFSFLYCRILSSPYMFSISLCFYCISSLLFLLLNEAHRRRPI